jgi:hypothetical protein
MPATQPESAALEPNRRWYCATPGSVLAVLFLLEGVLWLSERFCWFPFNMHPGWTVLIAIAVMAAAVVGMLLWFAASLIFRWRFQFGIRFMLAGVAMVAVLCSWMSVEMKAAREQKAVVDIMDSHHIGYEYETEDADLEDPFGNPPQEPDWLHELLGFDFFGHVYAVSASGDDGLECLARLPHLKKLELKSMGNTAVTDAALKAAGQLSRLEELSVASEDITDDGLRHLEELTSLQKLSIDSDGITGDGLKYLKGLGMLRTLRLTCPRLQDSGLQRVGELTQLDDLSFCADSCPYSTRVPSLLRNTNLAGLKGLCRLKYLDLQHTKVGDASLKHVEAMTELENLNIEGCSISDIGLASLKELTKLQNLNLKDTEITDAGLKFLKGLAHLETLDLDNDDVTDVGLEHLKSLQNLKQLLLSDTAVTDEGVKKLRQALPNCSIECVVLRRTVPTPPVGN